MFHNLVLVTYDTFYSTRLFFLNRVGLLQNDV